VPENFAVQITSHTFDRSDEYQGQLDDLLENVFGFRLTPWIARNQWTEDYTCYSIIEDGVMLANVSAYRMKMRVSGREITCMQLGAVATRKERRGQGLSRMILESVLNASSDTPFFLYANSSVVDFYPKFGFRAAQEYQPWTAYRIGSQNGAMKKLSIESPETGTYLRERMCYSSLLDCLNAGPIHWFNLLAGYGELIYEIPKLDAMIAAQQAGNILTIFDVWSKHPVLFSELAGFLDFPGVEQIHFGFNPDWLGLGYSVTPLIEEGNMLFVRGDFNLPDRAMMPLLART
jgi:GNAT superfamily N-acetyltransferase